ncbi:hypothetical protein F4679DRAFT_589289 [Xylaria curta]|nr:hypothetical protein F4679DRAFT_589289 [Xylaria curta]
MTRPETREAAQAHIAEIRRSKGFDAGSGDGNCNVHDLDAALEILSAELYQQSTHFLLELIQNADDCSYDDRSSDDEIPTMYIRYWNGRLRVDYNEDGFTKADVQALCRIKNSTKVTTESKIGEKGIGFKSVFRMANVVWIHSYNYSFRFDKREKLGMITPTWDDFPATRRENFTSILLQVPKDDDQKELVREMKSLTPKCLMFLRRIRQINIQIDEGEGEGYKARLLRNDELSRDESRRNTTLQHNDLIVNYYVIRHDIDELPLEPRRMNKTKSTIELAFPTTADCDEPVVESQQVYAFLPIRDYGFKFLLNADFLLTANRQDIATTSNWNKAIVKCVEDALIKAIQLLNDSTLRYKWPRYLPNPLTFSNIFRSLRMDKLRQSPVLKSEDEGWIAPLSARYVPASLRDDLNNPLISNLETRSRNLSLKYDSDWEYIKNLGVRELSHSEFLEDVRKLYANTDSAASYSERWHSQLAGALEPLLAEFEDELKAIPLIPLQDGKWVSMSNEPIFFLNEEHTVLEGINVLQLPPSVNRDPRWVSFLRKLGVQPFNVTNIRFEITRTHRRNDLSTLSHSVLISHVVFLFKNKWTFSKTDWEPEPKFWVATEAGPPRRTVDVYLDAPWPHSASLYFDKSNYEVHFLHKEYFNAVEPDDMKDWVMWLHKELGMWHIPRFSDISQGLRKSLADPEPLMGIKLTRDVLTLLRDNWNKYEKHFLDDSAPGTTHRYHQALVQEFSSARVNCLNGKPQKLRDTLTVPLLPENYGPEIQSLQHVLDIPEPKSRNWDFLRIFGVTVDDDIGFYLSTLNKVRGSEVPKAFISWLYDNIQSRTYKDNLERVKQLFGEKSIYIPSPRAGLDATWVSESQCVWNGTQHLRTFHVLKNIYPSNALLFKNILGNLHANFEILVSEVKEATTSTPLTWITQIFKEINKRLGAKKYDKEEFGHLNNLISMKVFPINEGNTDIGFENLCSGTGDTEWYIADRLHLKQSFHGVACLLAFTVEDILEMLPLIKALKLDSRLLSKQVVPAPQLVGNIQLSEGYTTTFREKSKFISRMLPKHTLHKAQLRNALSNIKVFFADQVLVRWAIKCKDGDSTNSELQYGRTDDGLKVVVLPSLNNKEIEVYIQAESDSKVLIGVAEQLATICGIENHAMVVYYILINTDESYISEVLTRYGIMKSTDMRSGEHTSRNKLPGDVSRGNGANDLEVTSLHHPRRTTWNQSQDSDTENEDQDIPSVLEKPQISNTQKCKETEEPDALPDAYQWMDTGVKMNTNATGSQVRTTETSVAANPSPDILSTRKKASDQSALSSGKTDESRQQYQPPQDEPLLPRPGYIWLGDIPGTSSMAPRRDADIVGSISETKELTSSKPSTMFNRPRIVGSPSIIFLSKAQDLPREDLSARASGSKTLPARARISQSGATTIFVASNPEIERDIEAVFLSELFVSQLLKRYLGNLYNADIHWTSHLRTRAYYPSLGDDTDARTTFTLQNVPAMTELLIKSCFKRAKKWRERTPVFYIQAHTTQETHDMQFVLSHENLERIRTCNTQSLPKSAPEEVFILILVSIDNHGARASWFIDPWRLYALGQLVVRPEKHGYVARIENAKPMLVSRDFGAETQKSSSPFHHGFLWDLFKILTCTRWSPRKGEIWPRLVDYGLYVYQPLPLGNNQTIRLLELFKGRGREELKGYLHHFPLESMNQKFQALSYVWGHAVKPFILETSQGNIGLTAPLYFGLQRLRLSDASVFVWADAICIDQGNSEEKSHQIRLMPDIYQSAEQVFVWLGEKAENSDRAMKCLQEISRSLAPGSAPVSEEDWDSINGFFRRPWFRRVWVVQELVLARKVTIFCGEQEAQWSDIYKAAKICSKTAKKSTAAIMKPIAQQADTILSLGELKDSYHEKSGQCKLLALFESFQHTRATLQRDKLFAFLGLACDAHDPDLDPDYVSSLEVIIRRYGRVFVKRGCALNLLYRAGYSSDRFPSWIPDWVTDVQRQSISTWPSKLGAFSASKHPNSKISLSHEGKVLIAKGYIVDTIDRVGQLSSDRTLYLQEIFQAVDSLASYPGNGNLNDLKWKIPIGDTDMPISGTWEEVNFRTSYEAFIEYLKLGEKLTNWEAEVKEMGAMYRIKQFLFRPQELRKSMWPFLYTVQEFAERFTNAKVCVTKAGYIGIVPGTAKKCDTIALFHGSAVPFLLRAHEKQGRQYLHLGECYIHGIMHGELRSREDLAVTNFKLY